MKPLALFGSEHAPLRCSMLDGLNRCPMSHILMYLEELEDLAGEAAATGSVAGNEANPWVTTGSSGRASQRP